MENSEGNVANVKRKKASYHGTCDIDHTSPPKDDTWPEAINMHISFEEAMKLYFALHSRLMKINSLNRRAGDGPKEAVNLCFHTKITKSATGGRLTIHDGKIRCRKRARRLARDE